MRSGYDFLARHWQGLEHLLHGDLLAKARFACLRELERQRPSRVLLVGDGDGRFLEQLVWRLPSSRITSIDRSPSMVALARARLDETSRQRVTHLIADAAQVVVTPSPSVQFDAVVTHFFFDQFEHDGQRELVPHLASLLTETATWHLADYQLPAGGWARQRARAILFLLYRLFGAITDIDARSLQDPTPLLEAAGFRLLRQTLFDRELLVSSSFSRSA